MVMIHTLLPHAVDTYPISEDGGYGSPPSRRAVRGMIHYVAVHARFSRHEAGTFWLSRLRNAPGMRFGDSIFEQLLKRVLRVQLAAKVSRHDGTRPAASVQSRVHRAIIQCRPRNQAECR